MENNTQKHDPLLDWITSKTLRTYVAIWILYASCGAIFGLLAWLVFEGLKNGK